MLLGLTGIRLELQDVAADCATQTTVHDRLLATERALAIEQRELRRLIESLRPDPVIRRVEGSLLAALADAAARLGIEWKTPITVDVTPPDLVVAEPLGHSVRLMLHEAMVNALQHAHPTRVTVRVEAAGPGLKLSVVDDGRGFPFQGQFDHDALVQQNLGPVTLRDRVASLHGRMSITSSVRGSRVDLDLPLAAG